MRELEGLCSYPAYAPAYVRLATIRSVLSFVEGSTLTRAVRSLLLDESFLEQHRTPQSGCFDALLVTPGAGEYVPSHQKIIAFGKPQFQSRLNVKDGACQQSAIWPYDMKERRPVDAFRLR